MNDSFVIEIRAKPHSQAEKIQFKFGSFDLMEYGLTIRSYKFILNVTDSISELGWKNPLNTKYAKTKTTLFLLFIGRLKNQFRRKLMMLKKLLILSSASPIFQRRKPHIR